MGLEALPARWHLLSGSSPRPPRAFLSVDGGSDCSRTLLTRRLSDASESSSHGTMYRRHQASPRASADGGAPSPGFPSRGPWSSEKSIKGGPSSSSLRRTESTGSSQAFPEQSCPSGLFRWKSDGAGLMRRATRFEDFPGDRWRRQDYDSCDAEVVSQGFEKSDVDVVVNPIPFGVHNSDGAEWSRSEPARYVPQVLSGDAELSSGSAEVSAVDVTAPSFVRDGQFLERSDHLPCGVMASRFDLNLADRRNGGSSGLRPASLKRKTANVCTSGNESLRLEGPMQEKVPVALGVRADCLAIPDSLRNLRKRNGQGAGREGASGMKKAFDSMVFMIRALQSHALQMRQVFVSDVDIQYLMSMVHKEMHSTILWLFQQVFSCTPTLMVSVMILLANFTVYSLGNNVAMGAVVGAEPPTELVSTRLVRLNSEGSAKAADGWNSFSVICVDGTLDAPSISTAYDTAGHGFGNFGAGGIGGRPVVAGGEDGDYNCRGEHAANAMFSEKEPNSVDHGNHPSAGRGKMPPPRYTVRPMFPPKLQGIPEDASPGRGWTGTAQQADQEQLGRREPLTYQSLLERTARELELKSGALYHHVQLDQETLRILVAPVVTKMESDNYLCFDRTDLEYQHAIRADPANAMLLANYAQFLYAVCHDNARAESYFHRAMRVDGEDGDILARWASFLWLALKDRPRAEIAYKEAISLDPSNSFHAGSYAHFLWHASDDEGSSYHAEPSV